MKYLKPYKLFETEEPFEQETDEEILELLYLWGMKGSTWDNQIKELRVKFEYPDRVNEIEIGTLNRVINELKPLELYISDNNLQGDCLKYLKLNEGLKYLSVQFNQITVLPELPEGLEELCCTYNKLTVLPKLPKGLKTLYCWDNQLKVLPELPESLEELECHGNQLTVLPELPEGLKKLYCGSNILTFLPELPEGLEELSCSYNQLPYVNLKGYKAWKAKQNKKK